MFLLDWNLTLYSKALPLEAAMRIWDMYLLEGEPMVLRAGLGVLRMYAMKLRKMTIEGIIRFLSRLPDTLGGEVRPSLSNYHSTTVCLSFSFSFRTCPFSYVCPLSPH